MNKRFTYFVWLLIATGIVLRFVGLSVPDLSTDEAQFILGASAAQPPLGLAFYQLVQSIFGAHIVVLRAATALLGVATLFVLAACATEVSGRKGTLITLSIAALFPSHILYGRLAYLSVPLAFTWALVLWAFLRAQKNPNTYSLLALFAAVLAATFTKTQGLLVPGILLVGLGIEKRKTVLKDPVAQTILFGLIPIACFIPTNLGILATLTQNTGSTYGLHNIVERIGTLGAIWWSMMPLFLVALCWSVRTFRWKHWPVWSTVIISSLIGLLLGPSHSYYTAHLIFWAIPLGVLVSSLSPAKQSLCLGVLALNSLLVTIPETQWSYKLFREEGYWNTNAAHINETLSNADEIVVLENVGHHIRWYLEPEVLVGKEMNLSDSSVPILHLTPQGVMERITY